MSELNFYTTAEWQALGSDCELVIYDSQGKSNSQTAANAIAATREFESSFSRFRSDSELSLFNQSPAGRLSISPSLFAILKLAQQLNIETKGFFDPTVIETLEEYGYSAADNNWPIFSDHQPAKTIQPVHTLSELEFHHDGTITKPEGIRLDLGGVGKSYLLKKISSDLLGTVDNYYLSLGGDIIIKGTDGRHDGWEVAIDHSVTKEQKPIKQVIHGGSLCTSGTARRGGLAGQQAWHHIIDPSTRLSLDTNLIAATVLGTDPVWTEQMARLALKEYRQLNTTWLRQHRCLAMWFTDKQGQSKHCHV